MGGVHQSGNSEPGREAVGKAILTGAMKVHSALGPGLLEKAYEVCLAHQLANQGMLVERQVELPVVYDGVRLDAGYRLDILVERKVVVEVKAVEKLLPIHTAQILAYLRMGGHKLGFLLNFNVLHMKDGIRRVVNGLED